MGVPKQLNRERPECFTISVRSLQGKRGEFSRFQAGFCWALSDFARISGPIVSGFDGFFCWLQEWPNGTHPGHHLSRWVGPLRNATRWTSVATASPGTAAGPLTPGLDMASAPMVTGLVKIDSPNFFRNLPRNPWFL